MGFNSKISIYLKFIFRYRVKSKIFQIFKFLKFLKLINHLSQCMLKNISVLS